MQEVVNYLMEIGLLEALGLIFGLLAVYFLIKENILTWPSGIAYVLVSLFVFYDQKLYGDFWLHILYLILNTYGWWFWIKKSGNQKSELSITTYSVSVQLVLWGMSIIGIFVLGYFLSMTDASVPYWDSATTVLSLTGMWLTARKKIENWHFWLVVDILATGVYFYKGIYFYAVLYLIYIVMAILGFRNWSRAMKVQNT